MIIYPAIDILSGKCVRLLKGNYDDVTFFSDKPHMMAEKWREMGAQYLHVVDLDGARQGCPENLESVRLIVEKSGIPVQLGGGIRTMADITAAVAAGVSRVILGTAAIDVPEFVENAAALFGDRIAVSIDAKDGFAAASGWERISDTSAVDLALRMKNAGVETIIYTDIDTDGTLGGPNIRAMEEMCRLTGLSVIASGGVGNIEHLKALMDTGVSGVIVGRALYTGNLDLREGIRICGRTN